MQKIAMFPMYAGLFAATVGLGAMHEVRAENEKRASPHEKLSATVAGKTVTVEYGRPYKKGRDVFGALVPYGEVWRTGADEATTLTTDTTLQIGKLKVPKGTYTVFTLPTAKEWKLIINKREKQWGAYEYDAKLDLGRVPMKTETAAAPVEQFTIALDPQPDQKTLLLKLSWDKTVASVPVVVADK